MGTVPSAGAQRQSTKNSSDLIEPIRTAGITIHITIGNHDTREKLWKLLPFLKKEQIGVHADVLELPHATSSCWTPGKEEPWRTNSWTGWLNNSTNEKISLHLYLHTTIHCPLAEYAQSEE